MTTWMTVPVDTRQQYLEGLVANCGLPADQVVIVRGSTTTPAYVAGAHHVDQAEGPKNIQRWWNQGINYAQSYGATRVFVAPDDVSFGPDLIPLLEGDMDATGAALVYPASCGMACYLLDLSSDIRPDERFSWWFGDDDLMQQARGRTYVVPADVAYVSHLHPNELTEQSQTLKELAVQDQIKYYDKWPSQRPPVFVPAW